MSLNIIWSEFAEIQLDKIFEYYKNKASKRVAKNILKEIINEPNRLINNPHIGQKVALLKERKIKYRYLIFKNYKLVYSVDKENIKIADVFDTRQYPQKIKRTK